MDESSRLLVANQALVYIWLLNHLTVPVQVLRGPSVRSVTNLDFGGADRKRLFCTEPTSGAILDIDMAVLHRSG